MKKGIMILVAALIAVIGIGQFGVNTTVEENIESTSAPTEVTENYAEEPATEGAAITAADVMSQMTLDEKIYQMLFVTPESLTGVGQVISAGEATKAALNKYPVGGIIYFSANIQNRQQVSDMIRNSQGYSKIPLFIGVDEEGGKVARLSRNAEMGISKIEPMGEVGASYNTDRAYEIGQTLGRELSALGFNVDFAPVADLLVNPNNTEIGDRSFGNDSENVSKMVEAVVKGIEEYNVSSVLKHFPGHGSTSANSHNGYSESKRTIEELRGHEFLPFKAGIDAGADFVLISHMTLPNVTKENVPASISKEIITNYLKGELGYTGLVITDSFSMGAITKEYSASEAIVKAIDAGVDIILMPQSVQAAHDAIKNAVNSGALSEARIDESVQKIINLKIKKGLIK